jgi:pyridoxal phosphate enzyme (YggS family)
MYKKIYDEIAATAIHCGRDPKEITLVAVSKQIPWEIVSSLYAQGQRDFGENRVIEALAKQQEAPADCKWHFIGNLQKNKLRKIIGKFKMIHSIDSLELAKKLSEVSEENHLITPVLLQANTSGELSKQGLPPDKWRNCFEEILHFKGISIYGLMTIAPLTKDVETIRKCFQGLRKLRDELQISSNHYLPHLSMGMSHDFKIAIEEGATLLRIGTALWQH